MKEIKNIIFDLGGVLLNIDYNATSKAFKQLGAVQFDELYSQSGANHLFEALETGTISEGQFYEGMEPYCKTGTTREQMEEAWNAILQDWRMDSLASLEEFKNEYKLYLLSNTNSIHHTAFNKTLLKATGKHTLDDYFTKSYYSHVIQKRKPYAATYHWVLSDGGMKAEETLFVDDSIVNINGAKEAGLKTHLLLPGEKLSDLALL